MKRIGILRGGAGHHYHNSLEKGKRIISHMAENLAEKWQPVDILIDKYGEWHMGGLPISPSELKHKVEAVWNVAHPGTHQYLNTFSIPSLGSTHFFSVLEHNPAILREHVKIAGYDMPRHIMLPAYQADMDGPKEKYAMKKAQEIFQKFGAPWIIKSFTEDKNMGMHVAKTYPELMHAILDGANHGKSIIIEELISGKVAGVHAVQDFRGEKLYVFPPGNFMSEEKEKLISAAKELHGHLGAGHYLKCDFVLTPKGKIYILCIDSAPDLREGSHFHQACQSVGVKMHDVLEHILNKVLRH